MNKVNKIQDISYRWGGIWLLCLVLATALALPAQSEQASAAGSVSFAKLNNFDDTDGSYNVSSLVQATDGNLYGAAYSGGADNNGTIFKMTPAGKLTTVYNFCSLSGCADGANPAAGMIVATDGNLYGTTEYGGASGYGSVYRLTTGGTLTTLYSFCSQSGCTDGSNPVASLVQGTDGNFYGTTQNGGTGPGTIFQLTPSGVLTTIHAFDYSDGLGPLGNLVQASDGNLYGTNWLAGPSFFGGTVFQITLDGALTTMYNFCALTNCADGQFPESGVIQATDGNLYGTTTFGGAFGGGTVFQMSLAGNLTTIYSFCALSACADGADAFTSLIQATDGNLYGVTAGGGVTGTCEPFSRCGTVFSLTPTGTLTTLHAFCPDGTCADGKFPFGGLFQATNGTIYGTTEFGGNGSVCAYDCGTIFKLPGLGPFVETVPTSGAVGKPIRILGSNLAGTTAVKFNGTAAHFKVVSSSEVSANVPSGATTGVVTVTTPAGTLKSNVSFSVQP